jgi:hypothetical protein
MRSEQVSRSFSISKSQNRRTVQPADSRASFAAVSRARVLAILVSQYSPDLPGVKKSGWPCQKRPSTKIATFQRVKARSGLPGTARAWQRQPRTPRENRDRRRVSSGLVSLERIRDITRLRVSFERKSVTSPVFQRIRPFGPWPKQVIYDRFDAVTTRQTHGAAPDPWGRPAAPCYGPRTRCGRRRNRAGRS